MRASRLLVWWLAFGMCNDASAQERNEFFKDPYCFGARWELEDSLRNGTFLLTSYRPIYVLPGNCSCSPNRAPCHSNTYVPPDPEPISLNNVECSFKTQLVQGVKSVARNYTL